MCGITIENAARKVTNAVAKNLGAPTVRVATGGGDEDVSESVHFDLFCMIPSDRPGQQEEVYGDLLKFCAGCYKGSADDVRSSGCPDDTMYWPMDEAELDKFMNELEQKY